MLRMTNQLLACAVLLSLAACNGCIDSPSCNGASSSSSGGSGSSSGSSSGTPGAQISGSVEPSTISVGSSAVITAQITNSLGQNQTGVTLSMAFPSSFTINVAPAYNCTPAGTIQQSAPAAGTVEFTLSNATATAASNCDFSATVTPPASGQYTITAGGQELALTVQ